MSGLLSVGDAKANVKAACEKKPPATECENDIDKDTAVLKEHTDVRYVLLRDIPLRNVDALPEDADGANAMWAPQDRDFPKTPGSGENCVVWKKVGEGQFTSDPDPGRRKGFCQSSNNRNSAWLFTLNGQRFPTITVEGGRNLLLRIGNLSANVAYWLELYKEGEEKEIKRLTILSVDGVVPAKPLLPAQAERPVQAIDRPDLLLMPASRAEVYVRNDNKPHGEREVYILRTKGLNAGVDQWPEIQLAEIRLEPYTGVASRIEAARNAPIELIRAFAMRKVEEEAAKPDGCVRDLDPTRGEHRRVTFSRFTAHASKKDPEWSVKTEIVRPPAGPARSPEKDFLADEEATVGGIPFEKYVQADGTVDWHKKHVCVFIDHAGHKGSHKQLWVLFNSTGALHNFHIHQMKFRLASRKSSKIRT